MSLFKSVNGDYSSTRVTGIFLVGVSSITYIVDQFSGYNIENFESWLSLLVGGLSLLGVTKLEYFGKLDKPK